MNQAKPVAVVTGVGPGTGVAIARRFARGGYAVAMLARNHERLACWSERSRARVPIPATSPMKHSSTPPLRRYALISERRKC